MQYNADAHTSFAEALRQRAVTPKVTDYGMARRLSVGRSHMRPARQGNPFYLAPEVQRQQQLRLASDVYSFGVMMWELMSGCPVYSWCAPLAAGCTHASILFDRTLIGLRSTRL
jgi:serine/threonine protein kinase